MNIDTLYRKAVSELKTANGTPELDAQVLLEFALKKSRTFFLTHREFEPGDLEIQIFNRYLKRRKNNEPIAYITGHKEFFGYDFCVNKDVLVPRPESEFLVQEALKFVNRRSLIVNRKNQELKTINNERLTILDIGTGSGCLIISLIKRLYELYELLAPRSLKRSGVDFMNFSASDISEKALNIARKNARKPFPLLPEEGSGVVGEINFYNSDLFSNPLLHKRYDIIIANLPYVPARGCHSCESRNLKIPGQARDDIDFEPQNAIFADENGSAIIRRFLIEAKERLNIDGQILIELDPRNALGLLEFARTQYRDYKIELKKDLAGLDRYLIIN